jgi:Arc/MetJ-type ribon-helix-helix transcriptional regulator
MTIDVHLPAELAEFVAQEVRAGYYPSEQAMIIELLREMLDERKSAIEGIRRGWESAQRGEGIEIAEAARLMREECGLPPRL